MVHINDNETLLAIARTQAHTGLSRMTVEGAPFFSESHPRHQRAVLGVFQQRPEYHDPETIRGVESVAIKYHAQLCAFEDEVTRRGFEPVEWVRRDHPARIAALTVYGTLILLGKEEAEGRFVVMQRICKPEQNRDGNRATLPRDLNLGERLSIDYKPGRRLNHSRAIGLAINYRGLNGDALEESCRIVEGIGEDTMRYLLEPGKIRVK